MQSSEEVSQINSALSYCTQLKTQLRGTLLHIQHLNSKYNQTDYMAVIRNLENYRSRANVASSPYPQMRHHGDQSVEKKDYARSGTPVKRPKMARRLQTTNSLTSTPKHPRVSRLADSFDSSGQSDFDTPKRSVRDMKKNGNNISVRTIKVQRNIEAIITHLQVIQRNHLKRRQQQLEQSLYQDSPNSSFGFGSFESNQSPGHFNHTRCMEQSFSSFGSEFGSNDSLLSSCLTPNKFNVSMQHNEDKRTLERVQRFYATPLQRMHKRLQFLNASLITTC